MAEGRGRPPGGGQARQPAVAGVRDAGPGVRAAEQARPGDRSLHPGHRPAARLGAPVPRRAAGEPGPETTRGRPIAQALADLELAIRFDLPGSPLLALDQAQRARLLLQEARHEEALAACEAALRIDRDHLEAHLVRIEVLRKLNRYADAIRSCDALLARGEPSAELYELRGLAREKIKDYQGAIEDYTLAIALLPKSAEVWARRGVLYLVTDAPRSALRDFQEAVRLDSANADAYVGGGLALAALGQHREAVADAAKALEIGERTRHSSTARPGSTPRRPTPPEPRPRRTGQDAVSLFTRYQDQAMSLLREWLKGFPPPTAPRPSATCKKTQRWPCFAGDCGRWTLGG